MPTEIRENVLNRDKIGQELFDAFVNERINTEDREKKTISVWSPMKKANLKTWKTARTLKRKKASDRSSALKDDRALFARFLVVVLSRPDLNVKESISTYELAQYPRALFTSDGELRHCVAKSKLMSTLEKYLPETQPAQDRGNHEVYIIDGMAIVQSMGKPTWVKTGRDLANHFVDIIDRKAGHEVAEVHVIFDRYFEESLKDQTRQSRQSKDTPLRYQISEDAVISKITMKQLLSCNENKECLATFLASYLSETKKTQNQQVAYIATSQEECLCSTNTNVEHLKSTQEEADTRMILHAVDAKRRGATSLTIESPDTDVLVLLLWAYKRLCPVTTLIVGTGCKRRMIRIGPLYDAIGKDLVEALPGFHALTGCDQTGTICTKSKTTCWKALTKSEAPVLEAFASLGSNDNISDATYKMLEKYICQLYIPSTELASVKDARWFLFSKKQQTDEQLPPTEAAVREMIKRANYVTFIWKSCVSAHTEYSDPTSYGWMRNDGYLQAIPTSLPPAPKAVLQLMKCSCKGNCSTMRCSCRKHSLKCTDLCNACEAMCQNKAPSTDGSLTSQDESDDDDDDNLVI